VKSLGVFASHKSLLIAGVPEVIAALHGTYKMGIVTSSAPDHFALIHQTTGLLSYFRFVIAASDFTHTKPHPEPYLLAMERSGFRKEGGLVIEESEVLLHSWLPHPNVEKKGGDLRVSDRWTGMNSFLTGIGFFYPFNDKS